VNVDPARFSERLQAASERTAAAGAGALVVAPSPDLAYLAGYDPPPLERPTLLIIQPVERPVLIVPMLERPLAAAAPAASDMQLIAWRDGDDPYEIATGLLPGGRVLLNDRIWGVHVLALQAHAEHRTWASAAPVLGAMRARKSEEEVGVLRRAAAAADAALHDLLDGVLIGRREDDVATELAALLIEHGHAVATFTIVASGPNAASPHHEPGDRLLETGDALVLDFGGVLDGYHSDTTRTVALGVASQYLAQVHAIVLEAHDAGVDAVRPGVPIGDVDAAARGVIGAAGFGERFVHRTGHGIGLEAHEPPYAAAGDETVLEPGMTFSVEPGIYLEGELGVRIEDIVVVTEGGVESLNRSPRDLLVCD
jgi:Xaa-Pro aminopeptidase